MSTSFIKHKDWQFNHAITATKNYNPFTINTTMLHITFGILMKQASKQGAN